MQERLQRQFKVNVTFVSACLHPDFLHAVEEPPYP